MLEHGRSDRDKRPRSPGFARPGLDDLPSGTMDCLRCGKCCFGPFYKLTRPEDVADWERDGISVPLEAYGEESGSTDHANHEMAALGMPFHTCRFLTPDGDRFLCSIYEHRPRTCREFEPGCSRLCPQYKGKKR